MTENLDYRNKCICEDYTDGKEIPELSRTYGITNKRVRQILNEHEIERRTPKRGRYAPVLSRVHERIGLDLYHYRAERGIEAVDAANDLGWNVIKLQRVEAGQKELELLDIINLATFLETTVSHLLREKP